MDLGFRATLGESSMALVRLDKISVISYDDVVFSHSLGIAEIH